MNNDARTQLIPALFWRQVVPIDNTFPKQTCRLAFYLSPLTVDWVVDLKGKRGESSAVQFTSRRT